MVNDRTARAYRPRAQIALDTRSVDRLSSSAAPILDRGPMHTGRPHATL